MMAETSTFFSQLYYKLGKGARQPVCQLDQGRHRSLFISFIYFVKHEPHEIINKVSYSQQKSEDSNRELSNQNILEKLSPGETLNVPEKGR